MYSFGSCTSSSSCAISDDVFCFGAYFHGEGSAEARIYDVG